MTTGQIWEGRTRQYRPGNCNLTQVLCALWGTYTQDTWVRQPEVGPYFYHAGGFCLVGKLFFQWMFMPCKATLLSQQGVLPEPEQQGMKAWSFMVLVEVPFLSVSTQKVVLIWHLTVLSWHHIPASQGILLKMAVSGVDNGYSRRPAEIRKPQAIRRGAKEGLLHSIMCECGPN